jgi:hypothetical protein
MFLQVKQPPSTSAPQDIDASPVHSPNKFNRKFKQKEAPRKLLSKMYITIFSYLD